MTLDQLYQAKGEAITQIEVWQAKLQNVNSQIVAELNKNQKNKGKNGEQTGPSA